MDTRGLKYAIDYLNSFHPIKLVPDELHKRAGCTCKVDTLSRKLRDNTNRMEPQKGRVIVFYDLDERGDKVAFYRGNPGFKFEDRKKKILGMDPGKPGSDKTVLRAPAVFFYAIEDSRNPVLSFSPYYTSREELDKKLVEVKAACGIQFFKFPVFTGSHEKPVRLI